MADPILVAIAQRAQKGLCEARKARKYDPPSGFTLCEQAALQALVEIEAAAGQLLGGHHQSQADRTT